MPAPNTPSPEPENQPERQEGSAVSGTTGNVQLQRPEDVPLSAELVTKRCESDPALKELVQEFDFAPLERHATVREALLSSVTRLEGGSREAARHIFDILQSAVANIDSSIPWSIETDPRLSVPLDGDVESGIRERLGCAWILRSLDYTASPRVGEMFLHALREQIYLGPNMFSPAFQPLTEQFCRIVAQRVGDDHAQQAREVLSRWGIDPESVACANILRACKDAAAKNDFSEVLSKLKASCA